MPWNWTRKSASQKSDAEKQQANTKTIARQCYQNRLKLNREGDAESDWITAEKIAQSPGRKLLFASNSLWIKFKPPIKLSLLFSAIAVCFTWWLDHQAEVRQQTTSQNLNHQRVLESYISNLKEISLSRDYNDIESLTEKRTFIMGMTLPVLRELTQKSSVLRELTNDDARKAQLVLLLYQLQMCGILAEQVCQTEATQAETAEPTEPSQEPEPTELVNPTKLEEQEEQLKQEEQSDPEQPGPDLLQTADLKFANFRGYKLPNISFRGADLRGADMSFADLRESTLLSANLSCHQRDVEKFWSWIPFLPQATEQVCTNLQGTNLQNANLNGTVLNEAILLRTDLRRAKMLTQSQLEGNNSPWLCNVGLPNNLDDKSLRNRDCDTIAQQLHKRNLDEFPTLKKAQAFVEREKAKDWKPLND